MNSLLVIYDLNIPGKDYATLIAKIKSLGTWWHCFDSTWLVKSTLTATQMRDVLKGYVDRSDEVIVFDATGDDWASYGLSADCAAWLKANH
jgi:hypothetical protein